MTHRESFPHYRSLYGFWADQLTSTVVYAMFIRQSVNPIALLKLEIRQKQIIRRISLVWREFNRRLRKYAIQIVGIKTVFTQNKYTPGAILIFPGREKAQN